MEDISIVFHGKGAFNIGKLSLMCESNSLSNEIKVSIKQGLLDETDIYLTRATAIKLSKELRKQIGNLEKS